MQDSVLNHCYRCSWCSLGRWGSGTRALVALKSEQQQQEKKGGWWSLEARGSFNYYWCSVLQIRKNHLIVRMPDCFSFSLGNVRGKTTKEMCFSAWASWYTVPRQGPELKRNLVFFCQSPASQQHLKMLLCKTEKEWRGDKPQRTNLERVSKCYHADTKLYSLYLYI